MKLILPKTLIEDNSDPTFFLMGPIKGGGDWQYQCCLELREMLNLAFNIAIPCRWTLDHPLGQYRALGKEDYFGRQTPWERHYLAKASKHGCIIVWLPREDESNRRIDGQPYSRDTYGELGEWRGRMMSDRTIHIAIGAEENFPGLDVILQNFRLAVGDQFPIYPSMRETIAAAISKSSYSGIFCPSCNQAPNQTTEDSYDCPHCGEKFTYLTY